MTNPTFTELLDWAEGRLDAHRAEQVAAHVAEADPATARTVAWIEEFLHGARLMPLHQPPPDLSDRLRAAFVGFHQPHGTDDWHDATLLYDTREPAAGMRSAGIADGTHLAYESGIGRFVIEASPSGPGRVDLAGLVLGARDAAVDLAFMVDGVLQRAARTDRQGRFTVSEVPDTVDEVWLTTAAGRARAVLDLARR